MSKQRNSKLGRLKQRQPAKRRAEERFGITLTRRMSRSIIKRIQEGKAGLVKQSSREGTATWDVEYSGFIVRVVYNSKENRILTFIPR